MLLMVVVGLVVSVGTGAAPAFAHAELESTTPSAGESPAVAPTAVELRFTEGIRAVAGGIRLIDESGTRMDRVEAAIVSGSKDRITLPLPALHDGAYVLSWRVVSADGHPIRGAFTFRVGNTGDQRAVASLAERLLSGSQGQTDVGAAYAALRILTFAAMLVLLGAAAYLLLVHPTLASSLSSTVAPASEFVGPQQRLRRVARVSGVVAVVAGLGTFLIYGPYASGRSFGAFSDGTLLADTLRSQVGRSVLVRTLGLGTLTIAVRAAATRMMSVVSRVDKVLLAAAVAVVLVAQTGTGHAAVGRWVAVSVVATIGHVGAAGAWLGGLVAMLVVVFGARRSAVAGEPALTTALVAMRRYSAVALVSVAIVVVTGVVEAIRQVGTLEALTTTTYGRLLLVKVAIVAALVMLGGLNRRSLQRQNDTEATGRTSIARLRRRMLVESAGALAIVAVASLLVNAAPARESVNRPVSKTLRAQTTLVDVTVDPARTGRNEIHFYTLTTAGLPRKVIAMTATIELPSAGVAPITLRTLRAGSNHFQVLGADVPIAGTWRLAVQFQIDEFTEESAIGIVTIR